MDGVSDLKGGKILKELTEFPNDGIRRENFWKGLT
jgi:hypothetical protein